MMSELLIPKSIWQQMRRHVQRCAPLEACGLLAGRDAQVVLSQGVRNDARSPKRYFMNPKGQLRAFDRFEELGLDFLGIYHSHPGGPRRPSPSDIKQSFYAVVQVIWSIQDGKWKAKGFWIDSGQVSEVYLRIIPNSN